MLSLAQSTLPGVWKNQFPSIPHQTKPVTFTIILSGRFPKRTTMRFSVCIHTPLKIIEHWIYKSFLKMFASVEVFPTLQPWQLQSSSHSYLLVVWHDLCIWVGDFHGSEHCGSELSIKWPLDPDFHDFYDPQKPSMKESITFN